MAMLNDMMEKRKSARPGGPSTGSPRAIAGRRGAQKSGLAAGRNPQLPGQRRKVMARHYRAKFIAGNAGRR